SATWSTGACGTTRSWCGWASSAARRASTRTPAAITGPAAGPWWSVAAASRAASSTDRPARTAATWPPTPARSAICSLHCTKAWASIRTRASAISVAGLTRLPGMTASHSPRCSRVTAPALELSERTKRSERAFSTTSVENALFFLQAGRVPTGSGGSLFGLHEAHADRKAHQAGNVVDVQPLHELHAMRLYGLDADVQRVGDLFGRLALGDQLQDLALPRRQQLQRAALAAHAAHVV